METRRATIRDVARAAGVSTTTVSEALSGRGRTAPETRERVRQVAEEIGYVASAAARSLRLGRSGAIGLYMPTRTIGFEYYTQISRGAAEAALGHGMALTLVPAWHDLEQLRSLHIDGLIVADPALDDPALDLLRTLPVPLVTIEPDLSPVASPVGVVGADHVAAMGRLLDHVRAGGATTIAVLAPGTETSFGRQVLAACAGAEDIRLVDAPLAYQPDEIIRAVDQALGLRPDAGIVIPDGAAILVQPHHQGHGLRVPTDVQLASYVDGPSLQLVRPAITALDIDPRQTGVAAVDALVGAILNGASGAVVTEIPAQLRARASTRSS